MFYTGYKLGEDSVIVNEGLSIATVLWPPFTTGMDEDKNIICDDYLCNPRPE
jgi:hypothetical protein